MSRPSRPTVRPDRRAGFRRSAGAAISNTASAGGQFSGFNGVYGQTDLGFGHRCAGAGQCQLNWALRADGFTFLDGDLSVSGTCTGCTAAMMAVNGSGSTLKQGDAVALDGVTQAEDGNIVLVVRAAKKNDAVIGVVDREMKAAPDSIKIGGEKRTIKVNGGRDKEITAPTRPQGSGAPVAARRHLRRVPTSSCGSSPVACTPSMARLRPTPRSVMRWRSAHTNGKLGKGRSRRPVPRPVATWASSRTAASS